MPFVVGVRFKDSGKTYHFDPGELGLEQGDHVIVETVRGQELAKVAYPKAEVPESEIVGDLKPVIRRADAADFERMQQLHSRHDEVLAKCKEKVEQHSLPMRLVKAEYSFDGSRLTFYFTAEKRVDFRLLVRDLARTFKTRIELRQIGPRDEAKLLGGIGPCGRLLCCATFLPDYARVSIKMAKDQDLPLNPSKISGVCGRLLCCLSYEHETYVAIKSEFPKVGAWVQTPHGPGEVTSVSVVRERATVAVEGLEEQVEVTAEELHAANTRVGGEARARLARGEAAPVTRQRRSDAAGEDEGNADVLEALELLEHSQAQRPSEPPDQRRARQGERGREGREGAPPPRPAGPKPQPQPAPARPAQPTAAPPAEVEAPGAEETHAGAQGAQPESQQRRTNRQRRRRQE
jgi:cell fate regulator YaaT (PSP1 superfamily)